MKDGIGLEVLGCVKCASCWHRDASLECEDDRCMTGTACSNKCILRREMEECVQLRECDPERFSEINEEGEAIDYPRDDRFYAGF
ncbi:hypothetical protein FACS1894172_09530 [Spirochaetia bacterium]|nr:hypothetical protein FACS1894172_09530 [Spirochaetia bacterium]